MPPETSLWEKTKATFLVNAAGMGTSALFAARNMRLGNMIQGNPRARTLFMFTTGLSSFALGYCTTKLGSHYLEKNDLLEPNTQLVFDTANMVQGGKGLYKGVKGRDWSNVINDGNDLYNGINSWRDKI